MTILDTLSSILKEPALVIGLACFAVVAVLTIPVYFLSRRFRPGTIEWIKRFDKPGFIPMTIYGLKAVDFVWALLCMLSAAFLRFAYCFISLRGEAVKEGVVFLRQILPQATELVISGAVFAGVLYFLQHMIFGSTMNAILLSVMGGLVLPMDVSVGDAAPMVATFLFFYCWMTAPYDDPLFPRALNLVLALICYARALAYCPAMLWFLPFFGIAYIVIQYYRWKNGVAEQRGKKLACSILLLLPAGAAFLLAFSLSIGDRAGWLAVRGLSSLTDLGFYRWAAAAFWSEIRSLLLYPLHLLEDVMLGDVFCTMLGLGALIPLLHGVFKVRNSRCLCLLFLLPCGLAAYLVSSAYLPLAIVWLIITGWAWSTFCKRSHGYYAVICTVITCLFFFAEHIIH